MADTGNHTIVSTQLMNETEKTLGFTHESLLFQFHDDFVELAFEIKWHEVILADGLPGVGADVKRLVQRNAKAHRAPDVACCDLLAVDEQRSGPTLTRAASVVVGNGITA
jgi:hypothetical protein